MERDVLDRERALRDIPIGREVWRKFADHEGNFRWYRGAIHDYKTPYYRLRYTDGDWEELSRREVERGRNAPTPHGGVPMRRAR